MKNKAKIISMIAVLLSVSVLGIAYGVHSKNTGHRHERNPQALQLNQKQDILSLAEILEKVQPKMQGELIETEFEIEDGVAVYEFKYISPSGKVLEIYVDAKTGEIIKEKTD